MIMVAPLPAGCRMTVRVMRIAQRLFIPLHRRSLMYGCSRKHILSFTYEQSCHSGSALDLPYIYSTEGKIKEPNLAAEAGQGLLSAVSSYARGDLGGVFKSAMGIVKTATGGNQRANEHAKRTKTSPADVVCLRRTCCFRKPIPMTLFLC